MKCNTCHGTGYLGSHKICQSCSGCGEVFNLEEEKDGLELEREDDY